MKITYYGYNAFLIESGDRKIAIDPGALFFYWFRLTTLFPKSEWPGITHIFITHGDIDHYWHADRVAEASNATVICNETMLQEVNGKSLMLGPRDKGVAFTTVFRNLRTLCIDETIDVDGMEVTGIKTIHGELILKLGPFSTTVKPGPQERIGWGAIGFNININGKKIVNLGDTLLLERDWRDISNPDVLMIPIGGKKIHNTMDVQEAVQAVSMMQPKLVIPCHYNVPAFFTKSYNPADENLFQQEVEKTGARCGVLQSGESINFG